jgi:hypothetical protein
MSGTIFFARESRVFGLEDWVAWLDRTAMAIFGLSGDEFGEAYSAGRLARPGVADDLASVMHLIRRLRVSGGHDQSTTA